MSNRQGVLMGWVNGQEAEAMLALLLLTGAWLASRAARRPLPGRAWAAVALGAMAGAVPHFGLLAGTGFLLAWGVLGSSRLASLLGTVALPAAACWTFDYEFAVPAVGAFGEGLAYARYHPSVASLALWTVFALWLLGLQWGTFGDLLRGEVRTHLHRLRARRRA